MVRKLLVATATLCLLASPALAKDGIYAGIAGGFNFLSDAEVDGVPAEFEFDTGYGVMGKLGITAPEPWSLGDVHLELEVSYRENDFDKVSGPGGSLGLDGDVKQIFGMINVLFDANTGTRVTPYAGLGVGWGEVQVNDASVPSIPALGTFEDEDQVFAFQPIVGVAFDVTEQLSLTADYRFFITESPEFDGVEVDNENHSLMFGARYHF